MILQVLRRTTGVPYLHPLLLSPSSVLQKQPFLSFSAFFPGPEYGLFLYSLVICFYSYFLFFTFYTSFIKSQLWKQDLF